MEGNYRDGKGGLKKACGTPHLSFVLSVAELVLCRVTGCCRAAVQPQHMLIQFGL